MHFILGYKIRGHPVALAEVSKWINENMSNVERKGLLGANAYIAEKNAPDPAAFEPELGQKPMICKSFAQASKTGCTM